MYKEDFLDKILGLVIFLLLTITYMVIGHLFYYAFSPVAVGMYYRELMIGIQPVSAALIIYGITTAACCLVIASTYDSMMSNITGASLTFSMINLVLYAMGLILWGIYYGFTHYPL